MDFVIITAHPHYLIAIKVTGNKESYYIGLIVGNVYAH